MHKADNLPPSSVIITKSGKLNFLKNPLGLSRPVMGLLYITYFKEDVTGKAKSSLKIYYSHMF